MEVVIEIDGVRHKLVEGHVHCSDCSFVSCSNRPYPLCNALAKMFGYHFEIEK